MDLGVTVLYEEGRASLKRSGGEEEASRSARSLWRMCDAMNARNRSRGVWSLCTCIRQSRPDKTDIIRQSKPDKTVNIGQSRPDVPNLGCS